MSLGRGRNAPQSLSARAGSWQQLQSSSAASLLLSGVAKGDSSSVWPPLAPPQQQPGQNLAAAQARVGWRSLGSSQSCAFTSRPVLTFSTSQQKGLQKPGWAQGLVLLFMHQDHLFASLPALLSLLHMPAGAPCWPRHLGHATDASSSFSAWGMLLWDRLCQSQAVSPICWLLCPCLLWKYGKHQGKSRLDVRKKGFY